MFPFIVETTKSPNFSDFPVVFGASISCRKIATGLLEYLQGLLGPNLELDTCLSWVFPSDGKEVLWNHWGKNKRYISVHGYNHDATSYESGIIRDMLQMNAVYSS